MTVVVFLVLHEYIIAKFGILTTVTSGTTIRTTIRAVGYIEHFTVRSAGTIFKSPPVILCRKIIDILFLKAGSDTILCTFLISWCILISCENSCSQMIGIKAENLGKQFKAPLASFFLKVITKAPASHHLKKGYMALVTN